MNKLKTLGEYREALKNYPDDSLVYVMTTVQGSITMVESPSKNGRSTVYCLEPIVVPCTNLTPREYIEQYYG